MYHFNLAASNLNVWSGVYSLPWLNWRFKKAFYSKWRRPLSSYSTVTVADEKNRTTWNNLISQMKCWRQLIVGVSSFWGLPDLQELLCSYTYTVWFGSTAQVKLDMGQVGLSCSKGMLTLTLFWWHNLHLPLYNIHLSLSPLPHAVPSQKLLLHKLTIT